MKIKTLLSFLFLLVGLMPAQTVTTFEGIDASQDSTREFDVDPNGAVGTKQFMEWTNVTFQAYDKNTFAPVWSTPPIGTSIWKNNGVQDCAAIGGDGLILFDRLASRWVVAAHTSGTGGNYYFCVAISSTDDLTSSTLSWYTYEFPLNPVLGVDADGHPYFPDWPKMGTWADAYYVSFDLTNPDYRRGEEIGVLVCALDRTNMLTGSTVNPMQCFSDPSPIPTNGTLYLKHSLIPADVDGTTPPPSGQDEFLVSIENPPNYGKTMTSNSINLWDFHVDWSNPSNSTFTGSSLPVPTYIQGCYDRASVANTFCIPELTTKTTKKRVDSVGDRLMPRLAYRNFGSYESFLVSHTIQVGTTNLQTGIRWYELRGAGVPSLYQSGTIRPDQNLFRFMPSIAQDSAGNAGVGYNFSSGGTHPGIRASWWNLNSNSQPNELLLLNGGGDEENSVHWGDYTSMTVDPVDGCTFWYVTQYFKKNETQGINWNTRISHFKVPTCSAR